METKDLRQLSGEELRGRVKQWKEDLFRIRFKTQGSEKRDTSIVKKTRKDVARALTILNQKPREGAEV